MRPTAGTLLVIGLLAFSPVALAHPVTPDLARRMSTLASGEKIPVIIRFAERVDLGRHTAGRRGAPALIRELRTTSGRSAAGALALLRAKGLAGSARVLWIINGLAVSVSQPLLEELAKQPGIESIEYDEPITGGDRSPAAPAQVDDIYVRWNLTKVQVPDVWTLYGLDGTGVVVGSMDSGVDITHPALVGKWRGGSNSWADFINYQPSPYDDEGHGTHTTGTILGGDGPGPFGTDVGVAYGARFISAKILDSSNGGTGSSAFDGAQWMLDPDGNPATNDFPDVINNSWYYRNTPTYTGFYSAVAAWRAAGIIPVFCMGNDGPGSGTAAPPGNYDNAIGVGATDVNDNIWASSSRGPAPAGPGFPTDGMKPDLSAPGSFVYSSLPGGTYSLWSGTSMATPHVVGTVALMLQANPGLTYEEVRSVLLASAQDLGTAGPDYNFGYGRLNALAAVTSGVVLPCTDSLTLYRTSDGPAWCSGTTHAEFRVTNQSAGTVLLRYTLLDSLGWTVSSTAPLSGHTPLLAQGQTYTLGVEVRAAVTSRTAMVDALRWKVTCPSNPAAAESCTTRLSFAGAPGFLFAARASAAIGTPPAKGVPVYFDSTFATVTRAPGDQFFISSSCDSASRYIVADGIYVNGVCHAPGNRGSRGYGSPAGVPVDSILLPAYPLSVTDLIPMGTSTVSFRLADVDRGIFGNTALYLVKLPVGTVGTPTAGPGASSLVLRVAASNPFTRTSRLEYELPDRGAARLALYSVTGRKVRSLIDGVFEAGLGSVEVDAGGLPAGVYFARLEAGGRSVSRRLMVLR